MAEFGEGQLPTTVGAKEGSEAAAVRWALPSAFFQPAHEHLKPNHVTHMMEVKGSLAGRLGDIGHDKHGSHLTK